MLRDTLIFQPFAETADSRASSLPDRGVSILQPSFNYRPYMTHEWCHVLAAAFNNDAEREHGGTALIRIRRAEVLLNEIAEGWEDLGRRK
jgi:hypothetical protein